MQSTIAVHETPACAGDDRTDSKLNTGFGWNSDNTGLMNEVERLRKENAQLRNLCAHIYGLHQKVIENAEKLLKHWHDLHKMYQESVNPEEFPSTRQDKPPLPLIPSSKIEEYNQQEPSSVVPYHGVVPSNIKGGGSCPICAHRAAARL